MPRHKRTSDITWADVASVHYLPKKDKPVNIHKTDHKIVWNLSDLTKCGYFTDDIPGMYLRNKYDRRVSSYIVEYSVSKISSNNFRVHTSKIKSSSSA